MNQEQSAAYVEPTEDQTEITSVELERLSEMLASEKLARIPESDRAYFYYRNAGEAKAAFKKTFATFLKDRYVIVPSGEAGTPETPSPR